MALTPILVPAIRHMESVLPERRDHCKAVVQLLKAGARQLDISPVSTLFELVVLHAARSVPLPETQWELLERAVHLLAYPDDLRVTWGQATRHPSPVVLIPSRLGDWNVYANAHWSDGATQWMRCVQNNYSLLAGGP